MEYNQLLELIKTVSESNITGFHYENGATKVTISTVESGLNMIHTAEGCKMAEGKFEEKKLCESEPATEVPLATTKHTTGNIVKSPLVGTFYVAPSEDAEPFVNVGDKVKIGQTLAIVEAMKLMNDIESEFDGIVEEVYVKNGDCVEYGQPLFAIR